MRAVLFGLAVAGLGFVGCAGGSHSSSLVVRLQEQNFSGQSGTAMLTPEGGKTRVAIELAGHEPGTQPAYIQRGACSSLDLRPRPVYHLNEVVDGKSSTVVDASLESMKNVPYAVTVHSAAKEVMNYTEPAAACGNIPAKGRAAASRYARRSS